MKPSDHKFHHPYEPYAIQLEFMQELYSCIEHGRVGIFESPTGTGKSLSLICAALTWLRDNERRGLFGDASAEAGLDWLEQAERKARAQQLLDERKELEKKLEQIRNRNNALQAHQRPAKRMKTDGDVKEDDFVLEDYMSDREGSAVNNSNGDVLSSSTLDLLEKLKGPSRISNQEDEAEPRTRIWFCSRTHSQLSQFVTELKKITLPSGASQVDDRETTKHVPLGSRKNLCINPKVSRLSSTIAMNERCLELQQPKTSKDQKCEFLPSKISHEDSLRLDEFKNNVLAQIHDIEDIADLGRKMKLCPYYAGRSVIPYVEVVTLPYPLLLQKSAREALSVSVRDDIVIVDEAHNLTSAIADTLSVLIPKFHLELAQRQLLGYCTKFKNKLKGKNRVYITQIIRVVKSCLACLIQMPNTHGDTAVSTNELLAGPGVDQIQPHRLVEYIHQSKLVYKVEGYAEFLDHQSSQQIAPQKASDITQPKGVLAEVQNLLVALMNPASEGRFFISRKEKEMILKYTLLDPQAHFQDIVKEARAVILAGGTMSPMTDWAEQLFSYVEADRLRTYSFGHVIDKSNILVQPLCTGPNGAEFDFTFTNRHSGNMLIDLGQTIERICATAPDGMVVFFPSYDYLAFVMQAWRKSPDGDSIASRIERQKQIFQESRESSVDELLREYISAVISGNGALMLAVVGGKLSEGINFSDKLGRVVICIGLPYPNIKSAEWRAKTEYIERIKFDQCKREGLSDIQSKAKAQAAGREYADNITMRAVNQSIGRAIRHKNDFAAIYLIDKRYLTPRIQAKLPNWLRKSLRSGCESWTSIEQECRQFFLRSHNA